MKKLVLPLLCILLIFTAAACKKAPPPADVPPPVTSPSETPVQNPSPPSPSEQPPELTAYERFTELLSGEWTCSDLRVSDIICTLEISDNRMFIASFMDSDSGSSVASYAGRIAEQWMDSEMEIDAPDFLGFDIIGDPHSPGGDYIYTLTLHHGALYMTFSQLSNGDGIFTEYYSYGPIIFSKPLSGAASSAAPAPRKDESFPAKFWEIDNELGLIWLEHVTDATAGGFYYSETNESVQYTMSPDVVFDIGSNELYQTALYTITTNSKGEVARVDLSGFISDSASLYQDYMDSKSWQVVSGGYGDGESFTESDLEISAYKIVDFDGDGTDELWLCAYDYSAIMLRGISAFCAIQNGEVVPLISCYLTGGTIGGDRVASLYDEETQRHVIAVSGYSSGWGGYYDQNEFFDYSGGVLTHITTLATYKENSDLTAICEIDGTEVSPELYSEACARFSSPMDDAFLFADDAY